MTPQALSTPDVVRTFVDDAFDARQPVLCLRWHGDHSGPAERLWDLPEGVSLFGPPPCRFAVRVERLRPDAYHVRLLWDRTCFEWPDLRRVQLLGSSLAPLLNAVGVDLWELLDQPLPGARRLARRAA